MAKEVNAIVAYPPEGAHPNWKYESIKISREPGPNELVVRVLAAGICHTDVLCSMQPGSGPFGRDYPQIMGHEGSGYVEAVGSNVTTAKIGDPVLLSYDFCEKCDNCVDGMTTYCEYFDVHNSKGEKGYFENGANEDVSGRFFGQSSFASTTIVKENSVVNVKGLVESDDELKLLSPLGCGLMTGAGAIINGAQARPQDTVLITGLGGVGLGAVMAAKVAGCKTIIVVDKAKSRLETAKAIGATHVLDTTTVDSETPLAVAIQKVVPDQSIRYAFDTTGVPPLISAAFNALGKRGKLFQIGVPPFTATLEFSTVELFVRGKIVEGHYLGNCKSKEFLPKMIQWWRDGQFPVEKLVKFYPAKDANEALKGMHDGSVIKPVLVW